MYKSEGLGFGVSHASLMLKQGIHPKIASEPLGHSSIGVTLDTCSHVIPGLQKAAALHFEEGLRQPQVVNYFRF